MIAALLLAQATVIAPAGSAATAVPPTTWSCKLSDAQGAVRTLSGTIPQLPRGRDPNRSVFAEVLDDGKVTKVGITGGPGGEWLRDYQISFYQGDATLVLNLRLRRETEGIAWLTRYDPSLGKLFQPYRYVSAGLCTAEFGPRNSQ